MTAPIKVLCPTCLSVIGHGLLAEHGNSIGGVVELDGHECPGRPTTDFTHNTRRTT